MSSWTLDEYLAAVQDDELFASVQPNLGACVHPLPVPAFNQQQQQQLTREALVRAEFYFGGGSARYMFGYGVANAVALFKPAINAVWTLSAGGLVTRSIFS